VLIKRNHYGDHYYTLPGGHVESGETPREAIIREVLEETSLRVTDCKEVFYMTEADGYLPQHIFVCDVEGDAITLNPESREAKMNVGGQNTYEPGWYELGVLASLPFKTTQLSSAIISASQEGWPSDVVQLTSS
jgi:8-oxo-dGTP pyrophosphatase MutT (NUDIX family)